MLNAHLLKLPSLLQAESFQEFARTRYLSSLFAGPTRAGELHGVRLLRRRRAVTSEPVDADNQFLMLADWTGVAIDLPPVRDPTVDGVLKSYRVDVERIGHFDPVAGLSPGDA